MKFITVEGNLTEYGQSQIAGSARKYSYLMIETAEGPVKIKNAISQDELTHLIEPGNHIKIIIGKIFFDSFIMAIESDGKSVISSDAKYTGKAFIFYGLIGITFSLLLSLVLIGIPILVYCIYKVIEAPFAAAKLKRLIKSEGFEQKAVRTI